MGLRDYLRVARRHWWLLVGAVVVALGVALVVNVRTTPVYAARITFFFTAPMAEAAELYPASMFSSGRLATYAELLTSEEIEGPLAAVPGVNLTPEEIGDQISADTVLMEVTVQDTAPDRAMLLTRQLSVLFKTTVAAAGSSLKTLAVTSAVPREGRSAIVCSLALLFAETGQRVLVVAARADGTLLVVRSRRTTNTQVTAAVRALHAVNASLLGCVLNMVPRRDPDATPGFDEYTKSRPEQKRWWGGRMSMEAAA